MQASLGHGSPIKRRAMKGIQKEEPEFVCQKDRLNCKYPYEYRIKICPASMCPNKESDIEKFEKLHTTGRINSIEN